MVKKVSFQVYDEVGNHHRAQGGTQVLIVSGMGKGKTTLLLWQSSSRLEDGEVCIWRGRETAQWTPFLEKGNLKFWVRKGESYDFLKIQMGEEDGVEIDPKDLGIEIATFKSQQDLIRRCKPGIVNVVYAGGYPAGSETGKLNMIKWWLNFFQALIKREDNRWISFFVDEFDDIVEEYAKGEQWIQQTRLKNVWKDLRKRFVSVYATTHNISDIDNRVAKKFQYFAYLPAARRPRWSRVFQGTIDSLSMGEGIIEGGGRFQPFTYPVIPFPDYSLLVRYNGDAG